MKLRFSLLFAFFIYALILVGCSNKEEVDVEPQKNTDEEIEIEQAKQDSTEEENKEQEEKRVYKNNYPLTGIGTDEDIDQRVFSVMVNNHPKARPQTGLHKADIVYEVLAEGFITRFLAIYQSELPETVGPIRSSRDYYIELSQGYDTVYIAYGGSEEALKLLDKDVTDFLNGIKYKNGKRTFEDDQFFYVSDFRKRPHNTYVTSDKMIEGAEARGFALTQDVQPLPFLNEEEVKGLTGQPAKNIKITFSNSSSSNVNYIYNEEEGKYNRYNKDMQTMDLETNSPIVIDNLFIVEASHKVVDNVGRRDINLKAGGKGYLIQKGVYQEVNWKNVDGRILPFKGEEAISLVPGKTWINIIPTSPGLENSITIE